MNRVDLGVGIALVLIISNTAENSSTKTTSQPPCTQFVHYDKSNFSITLPTINKITLGSMSKKSDKIQAAADLTQLFDVVQFSNCQILDRLAPDSKEFEEATRANLDANNNLLALAIAFNAYSKNPESNAAADKVTQAAVSSLSSAKILQTSSSDSKTKQVNLDELAKTFQGELGEVLANLRDAKPPAYVALWNLITEDKKKAIRDQLKVAMGQLSSDSRLQLEENDMAAFLVMPGGDGHLYFPPGLLLRPGQDQNPPRFSIPQGYGVSGVSFEENEKEFVEISDISIKLGTGASARESQKKARMIVIPGMADVKARYVAAFPIDNSQRKPIAVMTISIYKILPRSDDLENACQRLHFEPIQDEIADLLTLKK